MENQQQEIQPIPNQPVENSTPSEVEGPPKLYPEHGRGANKKIIAIAIAVVVLALAAIGAGAYWWWQKSQAPNQRACSMIAKLCPDGSSVGRVGPNCEFAPCPSEASCEGGACPSGGSETCQNLCGDGVCQEVVCMMVGCPCAETAQSCPQDCANNETSDWQTYRNEAYGFEFRYPSSYSFEKPDQPSLNNDIWLGRIYQESGEILDILIGSERVDASNIKKIYGINDENFETINVGGIEAYKIGAVESYYGPPVEGEAPHLGWIVIIPSGNKTIKLTFFASDIYDAEGAVDNITRQWHQILSTFKFIN